MLPADLPAAIRRIAEWLASAPVHPWEPARDPEHYRRILEKESER